MLLKTKLLGIALAAATLAPGLAFADHDFGRGGQGRWGKSHRHDRHCRHGQHDASPAWQNAPRGHYETRVVQKWVAASYESVWVPQTCFYRPLRHRTVCTGGFYEQQLRPGHYENVQEQVWVADATFSDPDWPVNGSWTARGSAGPVNIQVSGAY